MSARCGVATPWSTAVDFPLASVVTVTLDPVVPPPVRVLKLVEILTSAPPMATPAPSTSVVVIVLLARGSAGMTWGFSENVSSHPFISMGVLAEPLNALAVTVAVPGVVALTNCTVAVPALLVVTCTDPPLCPPAARRPLSVVTVTAALGTALQD